MRYFTEKEFERCVPSCRSEDMHPSFLSLLDELRERADIPLVLNCAYRSKEWDIAQGRSGNSAHTRGRAADIRCTTSGNRYKIIRAAFECGITRIGVGKTFIHIDNDESLPQGVIFDYYN